MWGRMKDNRGFTLLELLIVSCVLMIVVAIAIQWPRHKKECVPEKVTEADSVHVNQVVEISYEIELKKESCNNLVYTGHFSNNGETTYITFSTQSQYMSYPLIYVYKRERVIRINVEYECVVDLTLHKIEGDTLYYSLKEF